MLINRYLKDHKNHIALLLILILGFILRIYQLDRHVFWIDEVYNILQAKRGYINIIREVGTPIPYFFINLALYFGKSEFVLASPSLIFGVLTIFLIYKTGKLLFEEKIGIISAFLLSISPMSIVYSRRVEHYPYFIFFSLLTLPFFYKIIESRNKEYWFGAFVISTFLNLFTHAFSIFVLIIEVTFSVFLITVNFRKTIRWLTDRSIRTKIAFFLGFIIVIFVFLQSYYPKYILEQARFDPSARTELGYSLERQLNSHYLKFCPEFFKSMFSFFSAREGTNLYVYLAFFFFGVLGSVKRYKKQITLLVLWVLVPFLLLFTIKMGHWFEERYFLFILPVYLIIVSKGVTTLINTAMWLVNHLTKRLRSVKDRSLASLCLLIVAMIVFGDMSAIPIRRVYDHPGINLPPVYDKTFYMGGYYDWGAAFNYVKNNMKDDDLIFVQLAANPFAEYYLGILENITWFSETRLSTINLDEYRELCSEIRSGKTLWLVAERPIRGTLFKDISIIIDNTKISDVNLVSVYRLTLIENSPILVSNSWTYSDDYSSLKYLKDSYSMLNLVRAWGELSIDSIYHELDPIDYDAVSSITYKFKSIAPMNSMEINPVASVLTSGYVNVYVRSDKTRYTLLHTVNATTTELTFDHFIDATDEVVGYSTVYVKIEMYRARLEGIYVRGQV